MESQNRPIKTIPPLRTANRQDMIRHGATAITTPPSSAINSPLPPDSPTLSRAANIQDSEEKRLARKIFFLSEPTSPSPPEPQDDDFGAFPGVRRQSHHRKSVTALEAALPALVTKSPECKLYPYRYFVLVMFCLLSMSNAYQWLQYSIIQNVIVEYYDVSAIAVDWTSMLYMVTYIPLIFPATWLLNKRGLRTCILIAAGLNCLGACTKCFSASPDMFIVTFAGQTMTAIAGVFILGTPPQLAAVWFGPNEVSTACAIGVFGNQIGIAIGFVLPPLLVRSFTTTALDGESYQRDREIDSIGNQLYWHYCGTAVVTSFVFILLLLFFRRGPPHPPSFAQARNLVSNSSESADINRAGTDNGGTSYGHDLRQLLTSRNFLLLLISYGINTGIYYAIGTRLNYIILNYFPGKEQEAGFIGLTIILSGLLGSVICGIILDKTKKFKATTAVIYFLSLVATFGFAFLLDLRDMYVAFLTAGALGFFMTGYLPVGFEFAVELTYPVQEGTSSGMLNASAQVFGMIFTILLGVLQPWSVFYSNVMMAALLVVGLVLTLSIQSNVLKRAQASMMFSDMILDNSNQKKKASKLLTSEEHSLLAKSVNG